MALLQSQKIIHRKAAIPRRTIYSVEKKWHVRAAIRNYIARKKAMSHKSMLPALSGAGRLLT